MPGYYAIGPFAERALAEASEKHVVRVAPRCIGAVLPQIRASESKGKPAIVNPQRPMGCAALMPEYSFTLDHRQRVEICTIHLPMTPTSKPPARGQ